MMGLRGKVVAAVLGLPAVVSGVRDAVAAGELNKVRGRTYVAASPSVKTSIPRTPGPYRTMVIGGHPDDADIIYGFGDVRRSRRTSSC